jgi:hypothetical protein
MRDTKEDLLLILDIMMRTNSCLFAFGLVEKENISNWG